MNVYGKNDEGEATYPYEQQFRGVKEEDLKLNQDATKTSGFPFFSILIWSLFATVISIVVPFIFGLVSPQQMQDFYTGWALHQNGQMYTDYFGTNGLLYYLLTYLSLGSILLALVEWLALFGAGVFLFKVADTLVDQENEAKRVVFILYLLVAGLAFGGGYALLLALPFLFYSLNVVTNYLAYPNDDKGFVRVGMSLALAFFLAPLPTALFAAALALGIIGFNLGKGRFVHGLYQFFASALGFSLLFYPLGYYTVWTGSFGDAISQTLYPVNTLSLFSNAHLLENAAFYGLLAVGLGSLSLLFTGLFQSKPAKQYALSIAASLGFLVYLGILILSNEPVNGTRLVILLPFLILLLLTGIKEDVSDGASRRRRRREKQTSFLKGNFYLPLIALAYLVVLPIVSRYLSHPATYQERDRLASVVKQQTSSEDRVYAWDDRPDFYRASERLAPTSIVTPTLYTASDENKTKLMNDLKENQPKMIMVNQKVALWSDVESWLSEKYELVQTDTSEFKLYKSK